jgi:integrase
MLMGRRKTKDLDLPPRMARKGNALYYVPSVGDRKWIPLGSDKPKALLKWAEREGKAGGRTVQDAWNRYEAFHLPELSENTQRNYRVSAKAVLEYFGDAPATQVETQHIAEYLDTYPKKKAANAHVVLLSILFEKMRRWGWTQHNPTIVKKNPVSRRERYITDDEFFKLREASRPLVRIVMDLCYLTCSRQSDILKIKLTDIREDGLYIVQKKTGTKQVYTITPELDAALGRAKALRESITYLICDRQGEPYTQPRFQKMWVRDFAKTDVEGVVFHDIRGKAATDAKKLGMDYQGLLGHSRRDTSDSYIRAIEGSRVRPLR